MIAIFLVLRLRGVLGRRDGDENGLEGMMKRDRPEDPADGNVIQLADRNEPGSVNDNAATDASLDDQESWATDDLARGVRDIRSLEPSFNGEDFLVGARVAFEMILNAYASGDTETLKQLLSNDVYSNFAKVIQDREQAGHVMEDTLVGIQAADIMEAYLEGRVAHITVKFVTDQINLIRDENGDVVDGSPNAVTSVTDFWTFAHDTKSRNPNWSLVATRSLD